jgi:hypothetical protein
VAEEPPRTTGGDPGLGTGTDTSAEPPRDLAGAEFDGTFEAVLAELRTARPTAKVIATPIHPAIVDLWMPANGFMASPFLSGLHAWRM